MIAYVVNGGLSTGRATDNVDRLITEVRAATLREVLGVVLIMIDDNHYRDAAIKICNVINDKLQSSQPDS